MLVRREGVDVAKTLFRFVKQVASLTQKYSAAGLLKISSPRGNGFAGWVQVGLHYFSVHKEKSYAGVVDLASEMVQVRTLLGLPVHEFPDASSLCRTFNRAPMHVWRKLLNRSAALLERSGPVVADARFFD